MSRLRAVDLEYLARFNLDAGLEAAYAGKTLRYICEAIGCGIRDYYRLRDSLPLFGQACERARKAGRETMLDNSLTIIDDRPSWDSNQVRAYLDQLRFYLKVQEPGKYGDRVLIQTENLNLADAIKEARNRTRIVNHSAGREVLELEYVDPFE